MSDSAELEPELELGFELLDFTYPINHHSVQGKRQQLTALQPSLSLTDRLLAVDRDGAGISVSASSCVSLRLSGGTSGVFNSSVSVSDSTANENGRIILVRFFFD